MIKTKNDMTTIKKTYVKPEMAVIEVEPQQMICTSGEYRVSPHNDIDSYTGEFD
ncbi:MAG: hypothetical protein J6C05_09305 [Prevotella sp.]|nr:hypothetical protein [Prevotella sp.]